MFTLGKKKNYIHCDSRKYSPFIATSNFSLKTPQTLKLLRSTGTKGKKRKEKRKSHHIKQVAQPRHHNDQENGVLQQERQRRVQECSYNTEGVKSSQTEIGEPVHSTKSTLWESSQKEATSEDFIV